ncbi:hypothetical protein SUGI_0917880 [Cryptomeria japonica]|nr:hypothetical protein SUGI_0917880 [Cryptomeria japonica]
MIDSSIPYVDETKEKEQENKEEEKKNREMKETKEKKIERKEIETTDIGLGETKEPGQEKKIENSSFGQPEGGHKIVVDTPPIKMKSRCVSTNSLVFEHSTERVKFGKMNRKPGGIRARSVEIQGPEGPVEMKGVNMEASAGEEEEEEEEEEEVTDMEEEVVGVMEGALMLGLGTGIVLPEGAALTISPAVQAALNVDLVKRNPAVEEVVGSSPLEGGEDPEEAALALALPITLDLADALDGSPVTGFVAGQDVTSTTLPAGWNASGAALQESLGLNSDMLLELKFG